MTTPSVAVTHVRDALATLDTTQQRAVFLKELTYLFYDHAKRHAPGTQGPDGLTAEGLGLGSIVAEVELYWLGVCGPTQRS